MREMFLTDGNSYIRLKTHQVNYQAYFFGKSDVWGMVDYRLRDGTAKKIMFFDKEEKLFEWLKENGYKHMSEEQLARYLLLA